MAAADSRAQVGGLQGLRLRYRELAARVYRRQPEAVLVGEVVAGAARAVALDERVGSEVLETAAGAGQRLAAALRPRRRVLRRPTRTGEHRSANTTRIISGPTSCSSVCLFDIVSDRPYENTVNITVRLYQKGQIQ